MQAGSHKWHMHVYVRMRTIFFCDPPAMEVMGRKPGAVSPTPERREADGRLTPFSPIRGPMPCEWGGMHTLVTSPQSLHIDHMDTAFDRSRIMAE